MKKNAFHVIRLPDVFGRLPLISRFFSPLLMALILSLLLLAPQISASSSGNGQSLSLRPIPLQISTGDFWTSEWDSAMIYHLPFLGTYYSPAIHTVTNRFNYDLWNVSSPSEAGAEVPSEFVDDKSAQALAKSMSDARQSAMQAKTAYLAENQTWAQMRLDLAAHGAYWLLDTFPIAYPIGSFLNIYQLSSEVNSFYSYPGKWNTLMAKTEFALNNASSAVNGVYLLAQDDADALSLRGIEDSSYHGGATGAWADWAGFVSEANKGASANLSAYQSVLFDAYGGLNTTGGHYAQTYRVLRHIDALCNEPADPMVFDDRGTLWVSVNDLLASGNKSLWSSGWAMHSELRAAINKMDMELRDNSSAANTSTLLAKADAASLSNEGWDNTLDTAVISDTNVSSEAHVLVYGGTYYERLADANYSLTLSGQEMNSADSEAGQKNRSGYAVRAMALYTRAAADAASAHQIFENLSQEIHGRVQLARQTAQEKMQALQAAIDAQAGGQTGADAETLSQAQGYLRNATDAFNDGEKTMQSGERMRDYLNSISDAKTGLMLINHTIPTGSELYEMGQLLEQYNKTLSWGPALGVDLSSYVAAYNEYSIEFANKNPKPGSLTNLRIQLGSMRYALLQALGNETEQYNTLLEQSKALPARTSSLQTLHDEFAKWRSGDEWSNASLADPNGMRTQLKDSDARIHTLISQVISQDMCTIASFTPADSAAPVAGSRQQVGGVWRSSNPLAISYNESLTVTCPFNVNFYMSEKPSLSGPVKNAWATNGNLTLQLNPLEASEPVMVNFSSWQNPFHLSQTSCLLKVGDNRQVMQSNYTLQSDYPTHSLIINLPWNSTQAPGTARLLSQGLWASGTFVLANSQAGEADSLGATNSTADWALAPAYAHFLMSEPPSPANLTVEMEPQNPSLLNRTSFAITPSASGVVTLHYTLSIKDLSPCGTALVQMTETSDSISNLSVTSSDADAQVVAEPLAGRPIWSVRLTNRQSPDRIDLAVSYDVADPAQWVNLSLPLLSAAAQESNDSTAIGMASTAQAQANAQDWLSAITTLEHLRAYLDALPPKLIFDLNSPDAVGWQSSNTDAGMLLSQLTNFSSQLRDASSRPVWALDVITWRNTINASMSQSAEKAAKGDFRGAKTDLDSDVFRVKTAMLSQASKDKALLDSQYSALMGAALGDTDRQSLDQAGLSLKNAQDSISIEDGMQALSSLLDARANLDSYQSSWYAQVDLWASQQKAEAHNLSSEADSAQSDLETYRLSLTQVDSTKLQPVLKPADVTTWQKKLANLSAISLDNSPLPADPLKAKLELASRDKMLNSANSSLQTLRQYLLASQKSLSDGAQASYDRALAYLGDVRNNSALAATAAAASLEDDFSQLQGTMQAARWSDAIASAESITTRAQKLLSSAPPTNPPPFLLIGATIALAGGCGYVLLSRKKTGPKTGAGHGSTPASPSAPLSIPLISSHDPQSGGKKLSRQEE